MSTNLVYLAIYAEFENTETRACASMEDALHWLAFEAIPDKDWANWYDALPLQDRNVLTRDRSGMTAEEVLDSWESRDTSAENPTWGSHELFLTVETQTLYVKGQKD